MNIWIKEPFHFTISVIGPLLSFGALFSFIYDFNLTSVSGSSGVFRWLLLCSPSRTLSSIDSFSESTSTTAGPEPVRIFSLCLAVLISRTLESLCDATRGPNLIKLLIYPPPHSLYMFVPTTLCKFNSLRDLSLSRLRDANLLAKLFNLLPSQTYEPTASENLITNMGLIKILTSKETG